MVNGQAFARLMDEYGSLEKEAKADAAAAPNQKVTEVETEATSAPLEKTTQGLMQQEERLTGAVSWSVYTRYFRYAGGFFVFPVVVLCTVLAQGSQGAFRLPPFCDRPDVVSPQC